MDNPQPEGQSFWTLPFPYVFVRNGWTLDEVGIASVVNLEGGGGRGAAREWMSRTPGAALALARQSLFANDSSRVCDY